MFTLTDFYDSEKTKLLLSGLQEISGEYMNWMPDGFLIWVEGIHLPVSVITRNPSFCDYPGNVELSEGKTVHIIGRIESDGLTIHAQKWWIEDEGMTS